MNTKTKFLGTGGRTSPAATWFNATAAGTGKARVVIDKVIGSDWLPDWFNEENGEQSARMFIEAVEALGDLKEIDLEINSRGGDFYAGVRIYNYLKNHKAKVHARVTGIAGSIASVILMAGERREMATGTTVMVHRPMAMLGGPYNRPDLEDVITALDQLQASMVDIYARATGKPKARLDDLLNRGDSYLTAAESLEWGFATHVNGQASDQATAQARAFWDGWQAKVGKRPAPRSPKRSSLDLLLADSSNAPNSRAVYEQLNAASWSAAFSRVNGVRK